MKGKHHEQKQQVGASKKSTSTGHRSTARAGGKTQKDRTTAGGAKPGSAKNLYATQRGGIAQPRSPAGHPAAFAKGEIVEKHPRPDNLDDGVAAIEAALLQAEREAGGAGPAQRPVRGGRVDGPREIHTPQPIIEDPRIRASRGSTDRECGTKLAPPRALVKINNWKDGELKRGDSVFYNPMHGEPQRLYITHAPKTWAETGFVHVCNRRFHPTCLPEQMPMGREVEYYAICADALTAAPIVQGRHILAAQPGAAAVARKEKMKASGLKDIGDEVATMLRGVTDWGALCKLAAKKLNESAADLQAKYEHLDNGRRRMVIGNRLRAAMKKKGGGK